MTKHYRDFADFLSEHFTGKMQKLAVNAGLSCPNRDGTIGYGGCTYCNNSSFNPSYCSPAKSVTAQIETGKEFFARKYPAMRYLAYFQAYTNTHGATERLLALYDEALRADKVDGLIIGTRPDCMPERLLDRLREMAQERFVMVEYGAESSHNETLRRINRCHTWEATAEATMRTAEAGIPVGLHFINGLPGENEEMIMETVEAINGLPVDVVKFHQLQILKGTKMEADIRAGLYDVVRWTADDYIELCCRIISRLRKDIAIERFVSQAPGELLISPRWGLKNHEFTDRLNKRLRQRSE
ncbi:MAG: TIGR01212 family radical SAM protein [Barnesiella sp.]|nr:TIGR01212 family radical SAM protein [Barnesiella sp.]